MAPSNQAVRSALSPQLRPSSSVRNLTGHYNRNRKCSSNVHPKTVHRGQSVVAFAENTADEQNVVATQEEQIRILREENNALRKLAAVALEAATEQEREEFAKAHSQLQTKAALAGEQIPPVLSALQAVVPVEAPQDQPVVMQDAGVKAVVEVERDTLVFKFDTASSTTANKVAVGNANKSTSMAVNKPSGKSSARDDDETIVFNFSSPSPASSSASSSSSTPAASTPAATPSASVKQEEEPAPKKTTTTRRRSSSTKKSGSGSDSDGTGASSPSKATRSTTVKKVDPLAAAKAQANQEVASHDPAAVVKGREHWLYITVPEVPVAGADCVLYYNRAQSEAMRHAGKVQLYARFNNWEVATELGDRVEMVHSDTIPRSEGSDFYSTKVQIPDNAFEINFIFTDGDAHFDNNNEQNYQKDVQGAMNRELWLDTAPERAEAAYLKRKEEERVAAAAAEAERKAAAEKRDLEMADAAVSELKNAYAGWREGAVSKQEGLWKTSGPVAAGKPLTLQYNLKTSPLAFLEIPEDQHLVFKYGHNSWKAPKDAVMKRSKTVAAAGGSEWWEVTVDVPADAAVVNFVVNYFEHYDNNNRSDYKIEVPLPATYSSVEKWADSLLPFIRTSIKATREAEEAAAAAIQKQREETRKATRDNALKVRRKQMAHVLYTEPEVPVAGKDVTIYYNPNNTNLNGRQHVYLRGGYNRWKHPKSYGPLEMTAPATGSHFSATIPVPKDAYSLDFVFSEAVEGGEFDNRGGLDYHINVDKSVVHEPQMHVVHVAVEMAPIAKVGGLGDVVTALGRAVQEQGHLVEVILPRYDFFLQSPLLGGTTYETEFDYGGCRIFVSTCVVEGLRCFFIEPQNGMFATSTVYQGASDAVKFEFFCRAALEFLLRSGRQPDILHCHDWSSADVARYYWTEWHSYGLWKPKVIFTIHNMNYGAAKLGEAAYYSQRFTTVSPSYAWEIGGAPAIASNSGKLMGIRNGIDIDIWNPETDNFLPTSYTAETVNEGKAAAREELRRRLNLTSWGDKPLVGVVTRLTKQKGTHLIKHACYKTLERGGQYVLLGSAPDPKVQAEFDALANQHGGDNAAFAFAFNEPLSHLIYAACDMILVPSMFEPCGLTQMIAMRYGAVPIVRSTGGLRDTVFDVDTDKARAAWELEGSTNPEDGNEATNGFSFEGTDEGAMDYAMNRAFDAYWNDREWFRSLQGRVMRQDWSWNKPAIDYIELYHAAMK